ncbi:MAG TPA: sulfotransferase [Thermomicrobiales bacterium]|nr:sulfotransferase [Thermomicrobiales bacterium]
MDRFRDDMGFEEAVKIAGDAQSTPSSRPVAIVGMHRSGTSMVAKLLQRAGLNLGEEADLMPPAEENPEGFYEHLQFVKLNDEVLNVAGAGWDCPPAAGFNWDDAALDSFRARARRLAIPLEDRLPWGWKDPRTSLTLPFWRSAFGPLRVVAVVRNPLEVVTSLHRRNAFSTALGLTLWQIYAERILEDTSPDERLITHYDSYFLEPDREIDRVLDYLGLDQGQDLQGLKTGAIPELRHHRKTVSDLIEHEIPAEVTNLYLRLCREAEWVEGQTEAVALDPSAQHQAHTPIARGIGHVDILRVENELLKRINADREARIAELEFALSYQEEARAERDSRLIERNALIARRDHILNEQQQKLVAAEAELERRRDEITLLTERLTERERDLQVAEIRERDLRSMLTNLQTVQLHRDSEIMATLGSVLSRYAPNAPAAIYHRKLVSQVRQFVDAHVPPGARTLVITYGDEAMLVLGDRVTEPFPRSADGVAADYTDVRGNEIVAQLESLRDAGAEFLLVPSPALPWLAAHPELARHLDKRYAVVGRERGIGTIYALVPAQGRIPA